VPIEKNLVVLIEIEEPPCQLLRAHQSLPPSVVLLTELPVGPLTDQSQELLVSHPPHHGEMWRRVYHHHRPHHHH